jgi:hypothetical protein
MYGFGLGLVLLGLLAETPQGLASMGMVGVVRPGSLPGTEATLNLCCVGFALCACGLYRIARAKGRQGWAAVLGVLGVPGALVGLVVVALLRGHTEPPAA